MSAEGRLLEAIEEEDDDDCIVVEAPGWRERQQRRLKQKNRASINRFLGRGRRTNQVVILPRYYGHFGRRAFRRLFEQLTTGHQWRWHTEV